jgi:alanyl-tRNA synthetase
VLGLDPERIWISIYEDDDEAEAIWRDEVGVPQERIVRMGEKDNFWSAGPTGPCGPCSELYYDQGPGVGCGSADCRPGCDCDRFLEYWNLVFMQFDRQEDGTLVPLPKKNIDTGLGLERMAAILQGVTSNFETDGLRSIMAVAEEATRTPYGAGEQSDTSLRILTDHARSVTFMIADGILPSNEGRGYVLRRLLRRAVRHARLLGVTDPIMGRLVDTVIALMGDVYPETVEHRELISRIVAAEEQRFSSTLRQGLTLLEAEIARTAQTQGNAFDGAVAFTLHDTYGFPIELTAEIVGEAGLTVDMTAFEADMAAQRDRARAAVKDEGWTAFGGAFAQLASSPGSVDFVGDEVDECDAVVLGIVADGELVPRLEPGAAAEIVLASTPFYGEQGGQVGDTGALTVGDAVFTVTDTRVPAPGLVSHVGTLAGGAIEVGVDVHAAIDHLRRERIRRNHTATHILQWALRLVLGEHVKQSGSHVAADRMRFDFTHFEAMTPEQLGKVERMVNAKIMEDHPVRAYETSLTSAREAGVTALFGEKYGDIVRVLEVGNFSRELCGGTHVARTTEIGLLKVVSEGSVGANLRRIEAVTSFDAMDVVRAEEAVLATAAAALRCRPSEVADKVTAVSKRLKESERALTAARKGGLAHADSTAVTAIAAAGYPVVFQQVEGVEASELRQVADRARDTAGAVVLASVIGDTVLLLAAGSDAAVEKGFDAGAVIKAVAPLVGGAGGGKPQMAQAGGKDASGVAAALDAARGMLGAR